MNYCKLHIVVKILTFFIFCLNVFAVDIDNDFIKIDKYFSEIKQEAKQPILIALDGSIKLVEFEEISLDDINNNAYLLLPESHAYVAIGNAWSFGKRSKDLAIVRHSIWGLKLFIETFGQNSLLFSKNSALTKKFLTQIDDNQFNELFGSSLDRLKLLGRGGFGEVFEVSLHGKSYALKKNALEYFELEKLQFTNATVKTLASFKYDAGFGRGAHIYLIMEKGQKSLLDMNTNGEKLSLSQIFDAKNRFERLLEVERELKISNTDIKPANMIIDSKGQLVLIDISSNHSQGYIGTEPQLLAEALLGNYIGQDLRGSGAEAKIYFAVDDYGNPTVFPYIKTIWAKFACTKELDSKEACENIKIYHDFFDLFTLKDLQRLANEANKTIDEFYFTKLPIPNFLEPAEISWQSYWDKKEKIGSQFCQMLNWNKTANAYFEFFATLKSKYLEYCNARFAQYQFTKAFIAPQDPSFQNFVLDAYMPEVKVQIFTHLAKKHAIDRKDLAHILFHTGKALNDGVGIELFKLYNWKPKQKRPHNL